MIASLNFVRWCSFIAACVGLLFFAGGADVQGQEPASKGGKGKVIIILDASGSMWGKVPGGVKIDIAKKAISDLLPTIDDAVENWLDGLRS